jgi:23S rRNA (guanosine2251-2'-O)-methyltransferase
VSEPSGRIVYGVNPVLEALKAHPDQVEILYLADGQGGPRGGQDLVGQAQRARVRVERVGRERLQELSRGGVHQGVAARLREYVYAELDELLEAAQGSGRPPLLVLLDGIQDPQNLGAIIRSAHALGAHGVVIPKDRAAEVTGAVAKASAGAVEHCPVAKVTNLSRAIEELKQAGLWIAAADPDGTQAPHQARLDGPLAVVVGAEGPGVRKGVLEHCDFRLKIPMVGEVASLNASVSAAILLYEVTRQRLAMVRS